MRAKYAREIRRGIEFGRLHVEARDAGGHVLAAMLTISFVQGHSDLAIRAYRRTIAQFRQASRGAGADG